MLDRLEKEQWIAAARKEFVPSPRAPCVVCGKFKDVAQAHHVVPLAFQYDRFFEKPDHEHVWLCPTHHAIVHLFLVPRKSVLHPSKTLIGAVSELEDDKQYHVIMKLLGRAGREE